MIPIELQAASLMHEQVQAAEMRNRLMDLERQNNAANSKIYASQRAVSGAGGSGGVSAGNQASFDPWSKHREAAGAKLASGGFGVDNDPSNFYRSKLQAMSQGEFNPDDPSYEWRFQQGQQAAERSLAAKGLLNSGNAAIELQNYGQQAASQEYGAQFDRMLKGLAGVSSQYDQQQQRLMQMAGVNLDPTAGAKLNIMQQDADTNRFVAESSRINGGSVDNTGMMNSYIMQQNNRGQDALSSELFFGRPGGVSNSTPNFLEMWSNSYTASGG
jgi:hypothetical protein